MGIRKKTDVDLFLEWVKRPNHKKFTFHDDSDHQISINYAEENNEWFKSEKIEDDDDEWGRVNIPDPTTWVWEQKKNINQVLTEENCKEAGIKPRDYSKPAESDYWRGRGKKPRHLCSECGLYMDVLYLHKTISGKQKFIPRAYVCQNNHFEKYI
jgi:hypothetical protein